MTPMTFECRAVFGKTMVYPVCSLANELTYIADRKTFDAQALVAAERLGFRIVLLGEVDRIHEVEQRMVGMRAYRS